MAKRIPTVKVKFKDSFKRINKSDFDEDKHEIYEESEQGEQKSSDNNEDSGGSEKDSTDEDKGQSNDEDVQRQFGNYEAVENDNSPGWWNVVHTETQEVQNEKNLREGDAIAFAKELDKKAE